MENNILIIQNLKKVYPNGFQAIFDLSLKIKKGEFIVFVGPSGCGKTTTIRMIAGLEKVSSGEIILNNRNATDLPSRKRNISMVFQNYALFPHLTVKENISFSLKTRKVPRDIIEKKIKWAAEILDLKYLLNRKPMQLSGGQRQRVALGRAMVAEPTLFIMDEPLSNLDAKLRNVMRSTIRKLHDTLNTTSIYVTHDQVEAMTMADRIVVMSNGFIQQVGKPDEIFDDPANLFVASFIGSPSINLIDGIKNGSKIDFLVNNNKNNLSIAGKKLLRRKNAKNVVVGIRPQHVQSFSKRKANTFEYKVEYVELLGPNAIVFTKEGVKYVVESSLRPKAGDKIYLQFPLNKLHIFDKESGISLTSPINKETESSIKTFIESTELVNERKVILEKFKNKKINQTLYQKALSLFNNLVWPHELLINPKYSKLLNEKRKMKEKIKDVKRMKNSSELPSIKEEYQSVLENIKITRKSIYKIMPVIRQFSRKAKKLRKIQNIKNNNKNLLSNEAIALIDNLLLLKEKIKSTFDEQSIYDITLLNNFIQDFDKLLSLINTKKK